MSNKIDFVDRIHPQDMILGLSMLNLGLIKKIEMVNFPFYYYNKHSGNSVFRDDRTFDKILFSIDTLLRLLEYRKWKTENDIYVGGNYIWWTLIDSRLFKEASFWKMNKYYRKIFKLLKKTDIPRKNIRKLKLVWLYGFRFDLIKKHRRNNKNKISKDQ